jgi:hypothetical protein
VVIQYTYIDTVVGDFLLVWWLKCKYTAPHFNKHLIEKKERKIVYFLNKAYKITHRLTESAVSNYTDN